MPIRENIKKSSQPQSHEKRLRSASSVEYRFRRFSRIGLVIVCLFVFILRFGLK